MAWCVTVLSNVSQCGDDMNGALKFVALSEVAVADIMDLMNNPQVGAHLPLLTGHFSQDDCQKFLVAKQQLWDAYGFGPWAFLIDGAFAGWGGLQPEAGEADFALVLHPKFWGWGLKIFKRVKEEAFGPMQLGSITILLPPERKNAKAVTRMGFVEEGELTINGAVFRKFRLSR